MQAYTIKIAYILMFIVLNSQNMLSQETQQDNERTARKYDQLLASNSTELDKAILDTFASQLMAYPDFDGYLIYYGPKSFKLHLTRIIGYLSDNRGIEKSRLHFTDAGSYEDPKDSLIELWLIPPGEEFPRYKKYKRNLKVEFGKFYETQDSDSIEYEEGPDPDSVKLAALADLIKEHRNSIAYLVVFNSEDSLYGAWRRIGNKSSDTLQSYGVKQNRIKILFGGSLDNTKIEYWILPKDTDPPVKKIKIERKPTEAEKIGRYSDRLLMYEDRVKLAFEALRDILTEDSSLSGYVIVRLKNEEDVGETNEPEQKKAKLNEIAETWKKDLMEKFGIGQERFTIIVVPAKDDALESTLESWVIPNGAMLPNPFTVDDEESQEQEDEIGNPPNNQP